MFNDLERKLDFSMSKMRFTSKTVSKIAVIAALIILSCKDGISVYDPDYQSSEPRPVISNISPVDGYLAGVDSVIVTGENFSSVIDELTINFGGSPGVIKSATETQLVVRPGTITGDTVSVLVSRRGAEFFSNSYPYRLDPAIVNHPGLDANYRPLSVIAVDADESIYGFVNISSDIKFRKITKEGVISTYSGKTRFNNYTGAKFGSDGTLYLVSPASPAAAIFTMPPGGNAPGAVEGVWAFPPASDRARFVDLAFDNNGYIWVVGNNENIYRYTFSDKSLKRFPFAENLRVSYVYNNELYVAGSDSIGQKVWKFSIDGSGDLSSPEEVLILTGSQGSIRSLTFDTDGRMYLAVVEGEHGILVFDQNNKLTPLYEFVLEGAYYSLTWDEEGNIIGAVSSGQNGSLLLNKIDMFNRFKAPIYGID